MILNKGAQLRFTRVVQNNFHRPFFLNYRCHTIFIVPHHDEYAELLCLSDHSTNRVKARLSKLLHHQTITVEQQFVRQQWLSVYCASIKSET